MGNEKIFVKDELLAVSGEVQKVAKREGVCRMIVNSGSGFIIYADFLLEAETVRSSKIRKGSTVYLRGKVTSFGSSAVCLSDCSLF